MKNLVAIIAGDPESINTEIIAKAWKKKIYFNKTKIFVIGNFKLIKKQLQAIKIPLKIQKVNHIPYSNYTKKLIVLDVPLKFKNCFQINKREKSKYIKDCFKIGVDLAKKRKVLGIINCPINKKDLFGNENIGVTEFLAKKDGRLGKEAMIIYNKKLSVSPITTHIKLNSVSKKISKKKITNKLTSINNFFLKLRKKKPKIGVLGLNPHNYELKRGSEEKKIIIPAIKEIKKKRIMAYGPLPTDTAFSNYEEKKYDVLVGMYHDQVLSAFKALFKFDGINITAGLSFIRVSPDHGTGEDIIKKNIANPSSLIETIKFFNNKNVKI